MSFITFKNLEKAKINETFTWNEIKNQIKFNDKNLIPAIAQQFDSKEVLMQAWMNMEALQETLDTGRVCYWSRSRNKYWRKGEISGQIQYLKNMRIDCDGDALLLLVDQNGPACHSGRRSCFYTSISKQEVKILSKPIIPPEKLY